MNAEVSPAHLYQGPFRVVLLASGVVTHLLETAAALFSSSQRRESSTSGITPSNTDGASAVPPVQRSGMGAAGGAGKHVSISAAAPVTGMAPAAARVHGGGVAAGPSLAAGGRLSGLSMASTAVGSSGGTGAGVIDQMTHSLLQVMSCAVCYLTAVEEPLPAPLMDPLMSYMLCVGMGPGGGHAASAQHLAAALYHLARHAGNRRTLLQVRGHVDGEGPCG